MTIFLELTVNGLLKVSLIIDCSLCTRRYNQELMFKKNLTIDEFMCSPTQKATRFLTIYEISTTEALKDHCYRIWPRLFHCSYKTYFLINQTYFTHCISLPLYVCAWLSPAIFPLLKLKCTISSNAQHRAHLFPDAFAHFTSSNFSKHLLFLMVLWYSENSCVHVRACVVWVFKCTHLLSAVRLKLLYNKIYCSNF